MLTAALAFPTPLEMACVCGSVFLTHCRKYALRWAQNLLPLDSVSPLFPK